MQSTGDDRRRLNRSGAIAGRSVITPLIVLLGLLGGNVAQLAGAEDERYRRAEALFDRGEFSLAEKEFQAIVALQPERPEPYYFLGVIAVMDRRPAEGIKHLQRAVTLKPELARAWQALGLVWQQQRSYAEARKAFERVVQLRPGDARGYLNLARALEELGNDSEAERRLRQGLEGASSDSKLRGEITFQLGLLHIKRAEQLSGSDEQTALRELEQARQLLPPSYRMYALLGEAYSRLNDARAVTMLRQAAEMEPSEQAWGRYARAMAVQGMFDEAVEFFEAKVREDAEDVSFRILLGAALWDRTEYEGAVAQYEKAVSLAPHSARAQYLAGSGYQLLGRHEQAARAFRAALRSDPEHRGTHLALGEMLASEGAWQQALVHLEKARQQEPRDVQVLLRVGQVYRQTGRLEEALKAVKFAIEIEPSDKRLYYLSAQVYTDLGHKKEADRAWETFSRLEAAELGDSRQSRPYVTASQPRVTR